MRISSPLEIHKWLPVARAMPRMIEDLYRKLELGFVHAESWFSRTIVTIQYRLSMEQLLSYATSRDSEHLPAWQAFNKAVGSDGTVGIWHETHAASPGSYESVYIAMPAFWLGKVGTLQTASGGRQSASGRLAAIRKAL